MISCQKILENLSDYIDDALAAEVRRELESHINECRSCTVLIDSSRRTLKVVTDVGTFDLPAEVSERLLQKTLASLGGGSPGGGSKDPESK
ncbi:MAG TPA: zf-HC2 domain-containing protein [Candidatus Polarisedimenticolia bacterium]|nr:zf-HC2 domain-containing protein [Candidatus Polarisedimenticolia bacterium]